MVDDAELLELVEMEVRELLDSVRVSGRRHPDHHRFGAEGAGRRQFRDWHAVDREAGGSDGQRTYRSRSAR